MATQTVKYFTGTQELKYIEQVTNDVFNRWFGFVLLGKRVDSFKKLVGYTAEKRITAIDALPVTRIIDYKKNPSLHKCDARCRHAKGRSCECSCGGQFHGANA